MDAETLLATLLEVREQAADDDEALAAIEALLDGLDAEEGPAGGEPAGKSLAAAPAMSAIDATAGGALVAPAGAIRSEAPRRGKLAFVKAKLKGRGK